MLSSGECGCQTGEQACALICLVENHHLVSAGRKGDLLLGKVLDFGANNIDAARGAVSGGKKVTRVPIVRRIELKDRIPIGSAE